MTTTTPVVVHLRWFLRLAALPIVGFAAAAWWTLVHLPGSDFDGVGWVTRVVIGLIMVPVAVLGTVAVSAPFITMTYADDEITLRKLVRTYRIPLAEASEIRHVTASIHTGMRQLPVGRLVVIGSTALRFPPRAALDDSMTHVARAMQVLDHWVRQRPELVAGDTVARQVFVDRGVLPPE